YLDLVWRHLLPAFHPAPLTGRDAQDAALRDRLDRLALPPAPGAPVTPGRAADWSGAVFAPEGGACPDQPTLTGAAVAAGPDGRRGTRPGRGERRLDRPRHPGGGRGVPRDAAPPADHLLARRRHVHGPLAHPPDAPDPPAQTALPDGPGSFVRVRNRGPRARV